MSSPKKPDGSPRVEVAEQFDPLDRVLRGLDERGLFPTEEDDNKDRVAELPSEHHLTPGFMEQARAAAKAIAFKEILRDASVSPRDEWFGAWLKQTRERAGLRLDEVALLVHLRPQELAALEEKPVQIITLDDSCLFRFLDAFAVRLEQAASAMRRGLQRPETTARSLMRSSAPLGFQPMGPLQPPASAANVKTLARLDELVANTRARLEREGRTDLL
jgi:hypothetical protein